MNVFYSKRVNIFDTTLRDGAQSPDVHLNPEEKYNIARLLFNLGVDYLELFPASSKLEKELAEDLNNEYRRKIVGLARCLKQDIDAVAESCDIVHLFYATSDLHIRKYKTTREKAVKLIKEMLTYAKDLGLEIIFSPEDATRTDMDFLLNVLDLADEYACCLNIPDTNGIAMPHEYRNLISKIVKRYTSRISTHCHNDLLCAVANTLEGVFSGAREVHVTWLGIGERAGNADLATVAIGLHLNGYQTNINLENLIEIYENISDITKIEIPVRAPIVGKNAFVHESGIHVHGILHSQIMYGPINPQLIGRKHEISLGATSGTSNVRAILSSYGISASEEEVKKCIKWVKERGKTTPEELLNFYKQIKETRCSNEL